MDRNYQVGQYHRLQRTRQDIRNILQGPYFSLVPRWALREALRSDKNGELKTALAIALVDIGVGEQQALNEADAPARYLKEQLSHLQSMRRISRIMPDTPIRTARQSAAAAAGAAASRTFSSKSPYKARPSVQCRMNEAPFVRPTDDGGVVNVSINWERSVGRNKIGTLKWNLDDVLVVQATPKSSAFLADMGVKCYEVLGLRMGLKNYEVRGFAFQTECAGENIAIFSEDFRRGATKIAAIIEERFAQVIAEVQ